MRCDLHVHSKYSGPVTVPGLRHLLHECYSEPLAVYDAARGRGMDLVTLTDHDSIEGALELRGRPDFFTGEEVTVVLPGARELHVGVFDLDEAQHAQIARRRFDPESLFAYLAEQRLPACLNHPFSALTGRREVEDLHRGLLGVALLESRNGMLPRVTNDCARRAGALHGRGLAGGSDAHTLATVGRAFTIAPGARTRAEYLSALRRAATIPAGRSGSYARLTGDVLRILGGALREAATVPPASAGELARRAALLAALPLLPFVPLATLVQSLKERFWAAALFARWRRSLEAPRRPARGRGPGSPPAGAAGLGLEMSA
jgi:predicted metal-dependent phosphoesterase TrpH